MTDDVRTVGIVILLALWWVVAFCSVWFWLLGRIKGRELIARVLVASMVVGLVWFVVPLVDWMTGWVA